MSPSRPSIFRNTHLSSSPSPPWTPPPSVLTFHRSLPSYAATPLTPLPATAAALGLASVQVKDESQRLGLPAFKILGASWAVYRAVCNACALPHANPLIPLFDLGATARSRGLHLVTCTDGNWGRGVARMAKYLGIAAHIYVPDTMDQGTRERIAGEGAQVTVADGDYDVSIAAARTEVEKRGGLLVMDVAWDGYEVVPEWVVEGYSTMLRELDEQLGGRGVDLVIASVGVGSFAQAVTMHFKGGHGGQGGGTKVAVVEPVTAACFRRSLEEGKVVSIETEDTIMCGMNCGTVSTTAWPVLRDGVDASVIVDDREAHEALLAMHEEGVHAGPCGAGPLGALRKVCEDKSFGLGPDSRVVLFCTEGMRPYNVPM